MNSLTMMGHSLTLTGFLIYLLKVSLISGLLFAYYRLFLRDRMFHQYNRLFLLAATMLSVVLPFIPLPTVYSLTGIVHAPTLAGALHAITPGDWHEAETSVHAAGVDSRWLSWQAVAGVGYVVVSCGFLHSSGRSDMFTGCPENIHGRR
jgi:hypothetical protein